MRYCKLRGLIKERGFNESEIARRLGLSKSAISLRFNEKVSWNIDEAQKLCDLLSIPDAEVGTYFFEQNV